MLWATYPEKEFLKRLSYFNNLLFIPSVRKGFLPCGYGEG
jgi:hypothetical protein